MAWTAQVSWWPWPKSDCLASGTLLVPMCSPYPILQVPMDSENCILPTPLISLQLTCLFLRQPESVFVACNPEFCLYLLAYITFCHLGILIVLWGNLHNMFRRKLKQSTQDTQELNIVTCCWIQHCCHIQQIFVFSDTVGSVKQNKMKRENELLV